MIPHVWSGGFNSRKAFSEVGLTNTRAEVTMKILYKRKVLTTKIVKITQVKEITRIQLENKIILIVMQME